MTPTITGTVSVTGRVKQVLASVVLLIATIGVPAGLSVSVGWPLPTSPGAVERLPLLLSQPIPSSAVVDVLAVIAWLAWLHFTAGILVELINATTRRGRPQLRLPFGGPSHDLARSLVVTALLISAAGPLAAAPLAATPFAATTAAPTVASAPAATSTTRDVADEPGAAIRTAAAFAGGGFSASAGAKAPTVAATTASSPGDGPAALAERDAGALAVVPEFVVPAPAVGRYACLWDIAEQQLGDGTRWTEIYGLNVGRTQPDGQTLTDPDLIRPGWRLVLPPHTPHTAGSGPPATPVQALAPTGHLVVPGDTLWAIAETELGDGARYGELADAAATLTQPDGEVLRDPDVLQPGWTIPLPAEALTVEEAPAQGDDPSSVPEETAAQTPDDPGHALPQSDALLAPPHLLDEVPDAPGSAGVAGEAEGGEGRGGRWGSADTSVGSSAPQGPQQEDAASSDRVDDMGEAGDSDADEVAPAWALPGLSGAGTMLAGALLLLLRQHRRRQSRLRRPGRTLAVPDTQHVVVEKSVRAHTHTVTTIERLDQILRRLAAARLHSDEALPAVTVVRLDRDGVTVHLAMPSPAADPWTAGVDSLSWHLPGDVDLDQVGPRVPDQPAPFPLLVTVGVSSAGATTMLNLEHLGIATVTGDRQRGEDLLRYIAAEVGCNPWSEAVRAHCVGIAGELGPLNPERIRVTPATDRGDTGRVGPGPGGSVDPVADLTADAVAVVDRSDELDMDVPDARIRQTGEETWPPHLLLLDASHAPTALDTLADLIRTHPSRTGTTVLVLATTDPAAAADRVQSAAAAPGASAAASDPTLHISGTADLTVTWRTGGVVAGVSAAGLSAAEAQGCAALYALGPPDAPMPTPHAESHGWQAYADAAGALTAAHTLPRHDPSVAGEEREAAVGWGDDAGWPDDLEHEGRGDDGRGDEGRGDEGRGNEGRGNDEEENEGESDGPAYDDGGGRTGSRR